MDLPVDSHRTAIQEAFSSPGLTVLIAPPGTGKSTRVPRMLASATHRVVCVEPRRIAARSLAFRVSSELGESPGKRVGYRVRFDKRISAETRIEFVSRGVFLRQILENPESLTAYHAILLDEFHERQLETDWIFGLLLHRQKTDRNLRVGVLSATLNPSRIRDLWKDSRLIEIESPLYPVDIRHASNPSQFDPATAVNRATNAVLELVKDGAPADYLVFLPGYREIREAVRILREHPLLRGWEILPLSGEQSAEEQDLALRRGSQPRVVVATNLAESSLTVEGVRAVVDSGLARRMDHDPARGINALRTVRVSRFSALQRTGRAGRLDRGLCWRLWTEREECSLPEEDLPECQRLDLSEWLLKTRAGGSTSANDFPWIDPPPIENLGHAENLLGQLGALDDSGLTSHGRNLGNLPVHPRLAALILEGKRRGVASSAALLASLIEEDQILLPNTPAEEAFAQQNDQADFEPCLRFLEQMNRGILPHQRQGIRIQAANQILKQAETLRKNLPKDSVRPEDKYELLRKCCLAGFPDRIARRIDRGTATYRCRDGSIVRMDRNTRIAGTEWILGLEKRELTLKGTRTSIIFNLVTFEPEWIEEALGSAIRSSVGIFEDSSGRLLRQEIRFLDQIEVERKTLGEANESERATYFASEALSGRIPLRKWTAAVDQWIQRAECLRHYFPEAEVPVFDKEARKTVLEMVALETPTAKEFRNAEILPTVRQWLSPELHSLLVRMVPEHFPIPGRKKPLFIDYQDPVSPRISLRIQEAMSLEDHPVIAAGRCPLTVELLAPNHRPVQVTRDLKQFWQTSYPLIRKDLRGRYPKHNWPESL